MHEIRQARMHTTHIWVHISQTHYGRLDRCGHVWINIFINKEKLFLLMPLFPPSVDSGLLGKRPIRGSVAHLPSCTHTNTVKQTNTQTCTFIHNYISSFSVPPPSIVFLSPSNTHTHTFLSLSIFTETSLILLHSTCGLLGRQFSFCR